MRETEYESGVLEVAYALRDLSTPVSIDNNMSIVVKRVKNTVEGCILQRQGEQVYFSDPHSKKDYYLFQRSANLPAERSAEIYYNGSRISLGKLKEGTGVTLTIEKGAIVRVEVTSLLPQKELYEVYREGLVVFAQRRFSTKLLEKEYEDDARQRLAAQTIAAKCEGIRKVSSDAGKGFWTAVGVAYLEHLALDVVEFSEFEYFYRLLHEAGIQQSHRVMNYINELWYFKENRQKSQSASGTCREELIDTWHNNTDFQAELINGLKAITLKYAKDHPQHEAAMFLESGIEGFEIELMHNLETGEVEVAFAACALPIKLVVYSLDSDNLRKSYSCDPSHSKLAYIRLLKQFDAYYILYTESWLKLEGYDLWTGKRVNEKEVSKQAVMSLYFTPKDDRIQLQACATKERYDEALATLNKQAEIIHGAESFIISAFNTMKRRPLPDANLFDNDLLTSTYVLKGAYKKLLDQLSTLPPEAEYATKSMRALEDSGVLNDLQVMQRCDRCQNAISDAVLKCGHGVCKGCFFERVTELRRDKGYAIESSGEAARELTCPILDCQDFDPIPTRVLQMMIGGLLDAYIEEAEKLQMTRKCSRCAKVYEFGKFLLSSCACKLCAYCQLELTKTNFGICMCGVAFDAQANAKVGSLTEVCQQCGLTLLLWKDFTPVRCSEHIHCIKCLERIMKDEKHKMKAEPRCPSCYRIFALHEVRQAEPYFQRICDLYCGRYFDSSGALDLPCGCHYCEQCAMAAKRAETIVYNCFNCRQPFPQQLIAEWQRKLKENEYVRMLSLKVSVNYLAKRCDICWRPIGFTQKFTLNCNHEYHRDCVASYIDNFFSTIFKGEITCPKKDCQIVVTPEVLRGVMSPKDFERYSELLINANFQLITCPFCHDQMYGGDLDLSANAQVSCARCNGLLCGACMQPWQEPHDLQWCKFEQTKKLIAMLEASLPAGEASKIAQCPGCKVPYLKDENCDHMTCVQCKVEWCFSCSCLRVPTMAHSNAWHRPQCRFYNPPDGSEIQSENCPECKRLQRLCDPPPSLKVPRRFDFDEYI